MEDVDRFLLRQLDHSVETRRRRWKRDTSSREAYDASIEPNRRRLAHVLGVRDERVAFDGLQRAGTTARPAKVGQGESHDILEVR